MPERAETYVITELHQIKALADPLRQKILGAFVSEARTTKQVATFLGQPPTKLYHHVDLLERAGLIEMVETRQKRGTVEKYFRAIAQRFIVGEGSLGGEAGAILDEAVTRALDSAREGLRASAGDGRAIFAMGALRLAPEHLPELQRRMIDVAKELDAGKGKREHYRFLMAVYPSQDDGPLPE